PPCGAYLIFDEVKIVEQPFAGRGAGAAFLDRRRQQVAGLQQDAFVVHKAREQQVARATGTEGVQSRQRPAVLLHLVGAEQFRSKRRLFRGVIGHPAAAPEQCEHLQQVPSDEISVYFSSPSVQPAVEKEETRCRIAAAGSQYIRCPSGRSRPTRRRAWTPGSIIRPAVRRVLYANA